MNRRQLLSATATATAIGLEPGSARAAGVARTPLLMKLGCQSGPTSEQRLAFFKRHGVNNICGNLDKPANGRMWTVEELGELKDRCDKAGVSLDLLAPPFLASSHIDSTARPAIMLGKSPERDRDIDDIHTLIKNCAKVGIPAIKYNMSILGVVRTARTPGRGGTTLSTWRLAEAGAQATRVNKAGRVTADMFWERISYFLERVIPVAAEHKIRMACHPHDPGTPPGFQGVDRVLGTVDGLKKFVSIKDSPYHGLNFCQGTVSEMLQDPGKEIFDVIRFFGSRRKIFNVHFRNIRGRRDSFQETYPDEGDVNMVKAALTYKEVGYPYMLMPDHVPHHKDDRGGDQAFAFAYGYIRAVLQSLETLA